MLYAIVAVIVLIFDQALKHWTTQNIELNTGAVELIPGFIELNYVQNTGSAFGMLSNVPPWVFAALVAVFCILVIGLLRLKIVRGKWGCYSLVMVLAGALGNGIDRVINGYVVDMFSFEFISFPVFNIADIFITVGGILFCLYIIFHKDPIAGKRSAAATTEKPDVRQGVSKSAAQKKAPRREAPVSLPPVKPADPENPFAEWVEPRHETAAPAAAPARVKKSPAPEPDVRLVETAADEIVAGLPEDRTPAEERRPARSGRDADTEFSLEDIINEFKDLD